MNTSPTRNRPDFFFRKAGCCTRCDGPFRESTAYVVAEKIAWKVIEVNGEPLALTQREMVPVCSDCVDVRERVLADDMKGGKRSCPNCSLIMFPAARNRLGAVWNGRFCSKRCEQRHRRGSKSAARPYRHCGCCGTSFRGRVDARYCSSACRQARYRMRLEGHVPAPVASSGGQK